MTNEEALDILTGCKQYGSSEPEKMCIEFDEALDLAIKALKEKTAGEMVETKHRLNLLIGVLYSNQLISENDLEYIEDSIKELMKGGAV